MCRHKYFPLQKTLAVKVGELKPSSLKSAEESEYMRGYLAQDYAKANVFYQTLNVRRVEEVPIYNASTC